VEDKYKIIIGLVILVVIGLLVFNSNSSAGYELKDATDGSKILVNYTGDGGEVVIPDELNITEIGDNAFSFSNITKVKSNSVKIIGELSFRGCNNLTSVDFPNVETIGELAFFDCIDLSEFLGNPNIIYLGKNAFTCSASDNPLPLELDIEKYLGFESVWYGTGFHKTGEHWAEEDYLYTSNNINWYSQIRTDGYEEGYYEYNKI